MGGGGPKLPGPDLAALARAERDRNLRRAQAARDKAAADAKAAQEAAAREAEKNTVDVRGGMAQGEENLRQFRDNAVDVGRDVQSMGSDVLEFLTGARKPEDIKPGIQNTPGGDGPLAAFGYGGGKSKGSKSGKGKAATLAQDKQKQTFSKSSLYAKKRQK